MTKDKKNTKEMFFKDIFNSGEFYVKLCFTILFCVIFIVCFISFNGYQYFYFTVYADQLKGNYFQIHSINVNHGDCFLIKFPNNQCMLLDCGKKEYKYTVKEYLSQFMVEENINQIDYFVLSHPDSDHIGGAESILKSFKVCHLLRPPILSLSESKNSQKEYPVDDSVLYDNVISIANEKKIDIKMFHRGLELSFKGSRVEFLSPQIKDYYASNNYSAVMMITEKTKKFLFMGDAEEVVEKELIAEYGQSLKADLLKVGHHGSISSSSQEFLEKVNPEYAIISSGKSSQYFPHTTIEARFEKLHTKLLKTSQLNNFVVGMQNENIVYYKASRPPNILALIFSLLLIFNLIIWEKPFGKNKQYIRKK